MVELFWQIDHQLLAVLSNGQVWGAQLAQVWKWQPVLPAIHSVVALAWLTGAQ